MSIHRKAKPPKRAEALKLYVADLGKAPVQRYAKVQRDRGRLIRIGKVDVDIEQLALVVQRFIQGKGQIDLARWSQAVDLTAHRAGFLICNDLALSARFIQLEPATVGGMSAKDKIKELVLYSISEEYFDLRQHLGITIG